ncbi:MAG TPA: glycosyltransferase family 2 protein [Solirubrobacteraceae bacterium]|nr:glycosyltransferase family 2 protein [Solirubrobacteraceae bacterium]
MPATVSAIVVSFGDPAATERAVASLLAQTEPPVEVLVVDNHPDRPTATAMAGWRFDDRVRLIHSGENLGYTTACNFAARQASGEWLFFLNPDARADPACLGMLMMEATESRVGAIGAQVLLPDERTNAGDNPLHVTGIAWAGRYGQTREHGPARRVASVSGAALLARTSAFRALGGLCERFFMYYDDTDFCWRLRLAGWDVVFCPEAVIWHDYEFEKGPRKWYWLERNRLWSVMSNYSAVTLVLLGPLLAGAEAMVAITALRDGWGRSLMRAWGSLLPAVFEAGRWRAEVQRSRQAPDSELLELMSGRFETALVDSRAMRAVNPLTELYRRLVVLILRWGRR